MTEPATTWGLGDYALMAAYLLPAARAALTLARVERGEIVLDVATGTGNAALVAAELGASTTGVDLEPVLLDIARAAASRARAEIEWQFGDIESLPVADHFADAVISVFGVMYALDHDAAADELARVVKTDGRIAITAWRPGSLLSELGAIYAQYLPAPPPSSGPPSRWGDLEQLAPLLRKSGLCITRHEVRDLTIEMLDAEKAATFLIRTAGHVVAERPRLVGEGRWEALHDAVGQFVSRRALTAGQRLQLKMEYLLTLAAPGPIPGASCQAA